MFPIGKMLVVVGRRADAAATIERALKVFPGNAHAQAAREKLGFA